MQAIFILLVLVYFFYTLSFVIRFNKGDKTYSKKQKLAHNILIWIIPFFWILALKTIARPISDYKNGPDPNAFHESGVGIHPGQGSNNSALGR